MRVLITIPAIVLASWTSAASSGFTTALERAEEAMGTMFSVTLHGPDRAALERAAGAAFDEVHRLDRLLSNYDPSSEWSAMNRSAAAREVRVSDELFQLLSACADYSARSSGAFDITVGPLVKVWGFYKGEGQLPRDDDVSGARARVGYQHVRLDPVARTVRFDRHGMELDPGGIGKGYAVDRMVGVLKQNGVRAALISAGGSSIYGMGSPPGERGWRITIRDPGDPDVPAAEVWLEDMSLSTSGSYERFFRAGGRRYSHILDPRTGYPAQGTASVSVVAARTLDSEAWTKPFFVNGRAWASAHKPENVRVFLCADEPHARCAWIE
jgi:thiamine biosynthesis lipoprotein